MSTTNEDKSLSDCGPVTIEINEQLRPRMEAITALSRAVEALSKALTAPMVEITLENLHIAHCENGVSINTI